MYDIIDVSWVAQWLVAFVINQVIPSSILAYGCNFAYYF